MENMQYAEELVREFLVFRGFTNTLQAFETELCTDIGKGFQVEKILDLIFSIYIPKLQAEKLIGLLSFFKQCFSSSTEAVLVNTLSKLEVSILRSYIVHATRSGRKDKVVEFFGTYGNELLLQKNHDWTPWFAIPYLKNPSLDPQFRVYFSKEWYEALRLSVRNFFSEIFNGTHILLEWIYRDETLLKTMMHAPNPFSFPYPFSNTITIACLHVLRITLIISSVPFVWLGFYYLKRWSDYEFQEV